MPNHDSLRRREAQYLAGIKLYDSGSAMGLPTESSSFPTQSAGYQTQSVGGPYSLDMPPYFPLQSVTAPAISSVTSTLQDYTASATSGPTLYTGTAPDVGPYIALYILATTVILYLDL